MVLHPGAVPSVGALLTGVYRDQFARGTDRWLITAREFVADSRPARPNPPSEDVLVRRFDALVPRAPRRP